MAPPRNNDRHSSQTGTIPKTKVRNNYNVPQEVVTPTRRDMSSNLVSTSLDWVPVSEYNSRSNYNQTRKPANNSSDHELTDLDNSVSFESGFGRFVPVRPQPRALPLNRDHLGSDQNDDGAGSSVSSYSHQTYTHSMPNGLTPHSNHAAAAVMIVNPTTPNATGAISQPFNTPGNQNRNNLTRNLNPSRNNFDGNSNASNNTTPPVPNSRSGTKSVNLINNMYESGQGSSNNINDHHAHRDSARALGEAIVAACPDAAAVERRLGQIREYIRVTSSLVDTMRNSEDEAYIEHTKEEYDELVAMVMKLKESETKLEKILADNEPENIEVPAAEPEEPTAIIQISTEPISPTSDVNINLTAATNVAAGATTPEVMQTLKKVTNIENEQLNKTLHSNKGFEQVQHAQETRTANEDVAEVAVLDVYHSSTEALNQISENIGEGENVQIEIKEIESVLLDIAEDNTKDDQIMNDALRQNILSCVEKVALIEELKQKYKPTSDTEIQDVVVRPMSVQSNGSAYSENELWQNEIKNKMEMSQQRLIALKQQQKRLLKYQAEAKQQLDEMNRARQSQVIHPSTSHDNLASMQNQLVNGDHQSAAHLFTPNQVGVASGLQQSGAGGGSLANADNDSHSHEDRFSHRDANIQSSEEAAGGGRESDAEEDDGIMNERGRQLTIKLRELQMKKQHMESLVSEFQKLQMAARMDSAHNRYSSSGEESLQEEPTRKCNKSNGNNKNEDPFKLMEIKAIKTALQKTKDLMRSVETYEAEQLAGIHDETYQLPTHSNIHDNKSEGGGSGSGGGWSNDGSARRVRNALPQRRKYTNEQHRHQQNHHHLNQHQQNQQQHQQNQLQQNQHQPQSHEANIASLQELAQELRLETEKIMGERARLKDMVSSKEFTRKQKKVNEEVRPSTSGLPGPAERRQMELRALLTQKQRELESLLNKDKVLCVNSEGQQVKPDSRAGSIVNQSYNSEQDEPDSRSEQILMEALSATDNAHFGGGGDSGLGGRSLNTQPSQRGSCSAGASDSDVSRHQRGAGASDSDVSRHQRGAGVRAAHRRRRVAPPRLADDAINPSPTSHVSQNMRHDPRMDAVNVNSVPPMVQNGENSINMPYPHIPQQNWPNNKSNQDMRANQFTQNSHSQTMERLLATPQMSYPPSMPYNMMMPYGMGMGMAGACGCGCGLWGAWCWQQLVMQQREIQQLRDQLNHLEERWRVETASHTLNNQVPPGNRANNYWDNFRSYSRQNLLSASSKSNADGHLGAGPAHHAHAHAHPQPHPLVERSHNTLHPTASATPPSNTPKRNVNAATSTHNSQQQAASASEDINRHGRSNVTYERSLSFSSAPDVLNVNQNNEPDAHVPTQSQTRNMDENVNINRQDSLTSNSFRNLNIANPIPEIIQSHANNLNTPANCLNSKKKSSSKLPAKNSGNRRNYTLDYSLTSNINIASTSDEANQNAAANNRQMQDNAASQLFDFLRENVYSEVSALIGVNESHPDFLIQLFRELQLISSDPLRQRVLQSIRNVLTQYPPIIQNEHNVSSHAEQTEVTVSTTTNEGNHFHENNLPLHEQNACTPSTQVDNGIVRFLLLKSEEICTPELTDMLVSVILNSSQGRQAQISKKRLLDVLSKYEGMRVCDVSGDILESLPVIVSVNNDDDESTQHTSERADSSVLQDVAGSLNLFSPSDAQLHQMNCPYDLWPGHVHVEMDGPDEGRSARSTQDGKLDLINCSEMLNGDLAEADQTCRSDGLENASPLDEAAANVEALPDVVDTEETTPTEAEAEWLGLDRVPTRLHMEDSPESQKD